MLWPGVHALDLEDRPVHQEPLLGEQPLVVGQQRSRASRGSPRTRRPRTARHPSPAGPPFLRPSASGSRSCVVSVSLVGRPRPAALAIRRPPHAGIAFAYSHLTRSASCSCSRPEMAFLVFAAGPAPARLVAAEVTPRLGPVRIQQLHQRVIRFDAGAAQQPQPALGIAAIGSDAGQIEQGQRPVRIHRFGRQQLLFGCFDVADPLQCYRAQPLARHPRRSWHPRLKHLGEQAQCGCAGRDRRRQSRPPTAQPAAGRQDGRRDSPTDDRMRAVGLVRIHRSRQRFAVVSSAVAGLNQDAAARSYSVTSEVRVECVIEVEVVSLGQQFAPALELPSVEIESGGRQPLAALSQAVIVDDVAKGRQRVGEQSGVCDARGPDRRVEVGRFVDVESGGQPLACGARTARRRRPARGRVPLWSVADRPCRPQRRRAPPACRASKAARLPDQSPRAGMPRSSSSSAS